MVLAALGMASVYLIGVAGFREVLGSAIPAAAATPGLPAALVAVILLAFAGAMALQDAITAGGASRRDRLGWRAAHAHLRQGLYVSVLQARLVDRLWEAFGPSSRPRPIATPNLD